MGVGRRGLGGKGKRTDKREVEKILYKRGGWLKRGEIFQGLSGKRQVKQILRKGNCDPE